MAGQFVGWFIGFGLAPVPFYARRYVWPVYTAIDSVDVIKARKDCRDNIQRLLISHNVIAIVGHNVQSFEFEMVRRAMNERRFYFARVVLSDRQLQFVA